MNEANLLANQIKIQRDLIKFHRVAFKSVQQKLRILCVCVIISH